MNGRFDTDVLVLDEEGDVVALSRQVSLILLGETGEGEKEKVRKRLGRIYKHML